MKLEIATVSQITFAETSKSYVHRNLLHGSSTYDNPTRTDRTTQLPDIVPYGYYTTGGSDGVLEDDQRDEKTREPP